MVSKVVRSFNSERGWRASRSGMHALDLAANKRCVLVLGNYRQTITVVRSLARAGYTVILGTEQTPNFNRYSRCIAERWTHPPVKEEKEFLIALRQFVNGRPDIGFVFPVGELCMTALLKPEAKISASVRVIMPSAAAIDSCLNKSKFYALVTSLNIPLVPTLGLEKAADLAQLPEKIGFPMIVKPGTSFSYLLGRKALKFESAQELAAARDALAPHAGDLIAQRFFKGERHNCHFASEQGRLLSFFQHKVLRSEFPDDIGYEVDGITVEPDLRLRADVEKLLRALNYNGVGCMQFLMDPESGEYSALELNPRLDATTELPYRCGVDFPSLALSCSMSADRPENVRPLKRYEPDSDYPCGVRLHWLMGDIQGLRTQIAERRIGLVGGLAWLFKIARSTLSCDYELISSLRDPLPFLAYLLEPVAGAFRRVVRFIARR